MLKYSRFLIICALLSSCIHLQAKDEIEAYTVTGKGVYLADDGTWRQSEKNGVYDVAYHRVADPDHLDLVDLLKCTVTKVVDGDTIHVCFENPPPGINVDDTVRFLGIDTPELRGDNGPEPFAIEAQTYVKSQLSSGTAYLAFETRWRDGFGRLLAYVFSEEGELINRLLLSDGLAVIYASPPCHFHVSFVQAVADASRDNRGMWSTRQGVTILQIVNDGKKEFVELWNTSDGPIDISGWRLRDEANNVVSIDAGIIIKAHSVLYILSGIDTPPPTSDFIYPLRRNIWNNDGDRARLVDQNHQPVDEYEY